MPLKASRPSPDPRFLARPPRGASALRRVASAVARWFAGGPPAGPAVEIGERPALEDDRDRYYRNAAKLLFPGRRILVVEDNEDCRDTLRNVLLRWGFEVECAASARAAKSLLANRCFDFAVLDYSLPDGTGDELARSARAAGDLGGIRLIALTGNLYLADRSLYQAVLEKPLSPQSLREAMVDVLVGPDERPAEDPIAASH